VVRESPREESHSNSNSSHSSTHSHSNLNSGGDSSDSDYSSHSWSSNSAVTPVSSSNPPPSSGTNSSASKSSGSSWWPFWSARTEEPEKKPEPAKEVAAEGGDNAKKSGSTLTPLDLMKDAVSGRNVHGPITPKDMIGPLYALKQKVDAQSSDGGSDSESSASPSHISPQVRNIARSFRFTAMPNDPEAGTNTQSQDRPYSPFMYSAVHQFSTNGSGLNFPHGMMYPSIASAIFAKSPANSEGFAPVVSPVLSPVLSTVSKGLAPDEGCVIQAHPLRGFINVLKQNESVMEVLVNKGFQRSFEQTRDKTAATLDVATAADTITRFVNASKNVATEKGAKELITELKQAIGTLKLENGQKFLTEAVEMASKGGGGRVKAVKLVGMAIGGVIAKGGKMVKEANAVGTTARVLDGSREGVGYSKEAGHLKTAAAVNTVVTVAANPRKALKEADQARAKLGEVVKAVRAVNPTRIPKLNNVGGDLNKAAVAPKLDKAGQALSTPSEE
jgi:hypothetical protein